MRLDKNARAGQVHSLETLATGLSQPRFMVLVESPLQKKGEFCFTMKLTTKNMDVVE